MITVILVIGILISIASCMTIKFKFKQENSILITMLSIGIFLYVLGLVNLMKIGIYIIIVISILGLAYIIYSLIKKKIKIQEIFTLGTILYIITLVIISILLKNAVYTEWDEFSHWGSNLKAMVSYDILWSSNLYDGVHVVYPPLAGIIEYFFCKINGGFSESISYIAINTFIITLLLPIMQNLKYKIKDFIKGILAIFSVFCLIYIFGFKLCSIYIDLLLAALFAIGMFLAFRQKDEKDEKQNKQDKISIFLILISLVILKDTGLLLAGIILMQLTFNKVIMPAIKNKKIDKELVKKFVIIIGILFVILGTYFTWKIYCKSNDRVLDYRHDTNSIAQINISDFIKAVLQVNCPEGKLEDISISFYDRLSNGGLTQGFRFGTAIGFLVVLDIIGIILYITRKDNKEEKSRILTLWISMNIGFVLYCLLLMATFMFAFTEQEGRALASYERYMSTFFIAWTFMVIGVILNLKKENLKYILIAALICLYGSNMNTLINPVSVGSSPVNQEVTNEASIILENVKNEEKVYLIYQRDIGLRFHQLRYCISPIRTNLVCEWSLGPAAYEKDIWNYDITLEEFKKKLIDENFSYVFVANSDKFLIEGYSKIFEEDVDINNLDNKLFKVEKINENDVVLKLYK